MSNINGQQHQGYRNIDATPLAEIHDGQAVTFAGNGGNEGTSASRFSRAGQGTLGFFGADLGSDRPTEGRVPAFLGLAERTGGVYIENAPTVGEALAQTGLDYEVRHDAAMAAEQEDVLEIGDDGQPTMVRRPTGRYLPIGEWVSTVAYPRDGGQPFAIAPTSKRYTIVQNGDLLSTGEALSGGRLVALGAWANKARVYAAFELGDGFTVGGGDPYRSFVTLVNTHDRNGGFGIMALIRLGCTNQSNATFGRKATPRFTIRHTGDATVKIDEARRILGLAHQYTEALQTESEELLAAKMSTDQFLVYAKHVWGVSDEERLTDRSKGMVKVREDELLAILASETCEFGRGTAYAGFQAVTEHLQFFGTVKGKDAQAKRWTRILDGQLDKAHEKAWNLASEFATA